MALLLTYVLFTRQELNPLDEKQKQQLRKRIARQVRASPQLRSMLRSVAQPTYDRLISEKVKPAAKKKSLAKKKTKKKS